MRLNRNLDPPDAPAVHAPAAGPLDENLHYGRAWHRYRYCYRGERSPRILDVGCGTGSSPFALSALNPGASVLGVDASETAVGLASGRPEARAAGGPRFVTHDPDAPFPGSWGRFDFVVCRGLLGRTESPDRLLANLAGALAPGGLLLATFPSCHGRSASRLLRQAVDALAPPRVGLEERTRVGLEVMTALRPDHPVRAALAQSAQSAPADPQTTLHRFVLDALTETHEWTLDLASRAMGRAGLRLLYGATPWRWLPDRPFAPERLQGALGDAIGALPPEPLTALIDALDPGALGGDYTLYACPADESPGLPDWPRTRHDDPEAFDALVPHLTGLAWPDRTLPRSTASNGRTLYRTVGGALGELDRLSVLRLAAVDGRADCGAIDHQLSSRMRASDGPSTRQDSWIHLADSGFVLLQPPPP